MIPKNIKAEDILRAIDEAGWIEEVGFTKDCIHEARNLFFSIRL
ncbi:MAG TPA: hypothetical protein VFI70_10340 [Nitrososphaeraceae archaeon]|nr:hypothetical protein [Nitrososphaeraceae archaeon]